MLKKFIPLCAVFVLLSSCFYKITRHTGRVGSAYENISAAGAPRYTYNPSTRTYMYQGAYYDKGFASPSSLEEALKLKKKYGKDVDMIINYGHTQYEFLFDADGVVSGQPIQVVERNEEMVTSLSDDMRFYKTEHFNDNVVFGGFYENFSGELDTSFKKSTYLETKEGERGIFYSDAKYASCNWSLPVPGSSVTIKHEKLFKDAKYFSMVFFHDMYLKEEGIVTFKIPVWLNVEIIERNFEGYGIQKMDSGYVIGRKLVPVAKTSDKAPAPVVKKSTKVKAKQEKPILADAQFRYVTYKITNAKALKNESLYPGATHNLPHLLVLCKSYDSTAVANLKPEKPAKAAKTTTKTTAKTSKPAPKPAAAKTTTASKSKIKKDTVETVKTLPKNIKGTIGNTADLYHWCYEIAALCDNKLDSVKPLAMELIKDKKTDQEKVEAIYYWVQDNIRYVAFEDGIAAFKPDACQNVLAKKYGDCKGMANLIKCMLVSVGFDARLTWIGTRRLNLDYSLPTVANSNHMICTVILDGKRYFLDGTEKFVAFGDYAHRIQGRPVMIEDTKDNYIIDTIPNLSYNRNQHHRKANFTVSPDGTISGKVTETIKGENKTVFLYRYHYASNEDKPYFVKKHLKDFDPNFKVQHITNTDLNDRENDLVLEYDLTINFNGIKQGNLLLVKADYVGELTNHDNDTGRTSNIAYGHKLCYSHDYTFTIPQGYSLKELPAPLVINTGEYVFELKYTQAGDKIVYEKKIILKTGDISRNNITTWNDDLLKLEKGYESYIVFSKN